MNDTVKFATIAESEHHISILKCRSNWVNLVSISYVYVIKMAVFFNRKQIIAPDPIGPN